MTHDLSLVAGVVILILSIPAFLNAMIDRRAPKVMAISFLVGSGLIIFAIGGNPKGYSINELPNVFVRVVGAFMN
ncbi:hypothetical protein O2N63_01000 [Aliiroseovarius sp. KMU-50]|uniref:50S ribosomal protein L35 n=1 Tax=Aliiroseovarius salicola TaxID=3009082 RepID=A0ABT4VWN3_9RHOB|nr:hypothetical protein [Aliiroseovarius sp. KMU-50]MDA5092666.1 hypothetical protein [Aliiroseovarius sp. KMU-50]